MTDENFYKDKIWEHLLGEIKEIKDMQASQGKDIAAIKNKVTWIFGWASGVAVVVSVGFNLLRDKFFKS